MPWTGATEARLLVMLFNADTRIRAQPTMHFATQPCGAESRAVVDNLADGLAASWAARSCPLTPSNCLQYTWLKSEFCKLQGGVIGILAKTSDDCRIDWHGPMSVPTSRIIPEIYYQVHVILCGLLAWHAKLHAIPTVICREQGSKSPFD